MTLPFKSIDPRAPSPCPGYGVSNIQQKEQIMTRNYKNNSKSREAKAPVHIAYHIAETAENKSFWTRIGAAWDHEDGFTAYIELFPVASGRIVFREHACSEKDAMQEAFLHL
jgi:hypothetical protein